MAKRFSSYRLSDECHELLALLARALGSSRAGMIEAAVRHYARSHDIGGASSGRAAKMPAAVELGLRGGAKGGKARAAGQTPEQRSRLARKAAKARWEKAKKAGKSGPPG